MATDKRQFTLRLREDNFEKIRVIAERSKRSIAMQIEYLIEEFIREYERQYGPIDLRNDLTGSSDDPTPPRKE